MGFNFQDKLNIPTAPAYGVYISKLIRYSRACDDYTDFCVRGKLLTSKLMEQGFLELKSSLHCGQSCLSCSGIETRSECQHVTTCTDNEACFVQKLITESGTMLYDMGCADVQICRHGISGIFGRRSEGHHIVCNSCCNNTHSCNMDLSCDNNHHIVGQSKPRECNDITGQHADGVYKIYPDGSDQPVSVYCDMHTDGGKWTVIQRRYNGSISFERNWQFYKEGFGSPNGEYWLGNDIIHEITMQNQHELRIDMEDFDGHSKYAKYSIFQVGDELDEYNLTVAGYSGNAGDSLTSGRFGHNGMQFTTIDRDNDIDLSVNCALSYHGGWWYSHCHSSNLNGKYFSGASSFGQGINWSSWRGYHYSLKSVKMMVRRFHNENKW